MGTTLVQICSSVTTLKRARQLHAIILTTATFFDVQSPYLHNNVLSMYGRCGALRDARKVFDKMPNRSLVSYNALISACSRDPDYASLGFRLMTQIEFECMRPNGSTFTSLIQSVLLLEDRLMGSLLHTQVKKFGFLDDICVQTSLLGMYSNCGDLVSATKMFSCIGDKDAVAWNSIILGNLKNDKIREGLYLFNAMVRSGVTPTQFTYSMVLNGCSRMGDYSFGKLVHARVIISNIVADLPLENALLDMYCNCSDTKAAVSVFSRIENRDLVSWNSMIAGYMDNGDGERAMDLFVQLRKMSIPEPDDYTFAAIISATCDFPAYYYGEPLHALVIKAGFDKRVFVGTTLLSMYFKNGDTESAKKVFQSISEKDIVLWTEMIMGHSKMGDGESAIKFFCELCREGHKIDSFALSGVLSACADLAILKQGEMIHSQAMKTGYEVEMSVCGSLVDMYAKNGDLQASQSIFFHASNPDLKCWNAMLGGYSHHGMAEEALEFFEAILKHGLRPDQVTFLSLLSACNHSGLVEKGKFLWNHMMENGVFPGPKHYSCMVSLLSRAGQLDEAEKKIIESPYSECQLELWRTLLSSCVINRNFRLGVHAAEQVLRLDSEDSATHILLSNLYAAAGKWDGVAGMRKKMRGSMLEKGPGLSWIEAKNNIHVFSSGDQSHSEVDEAQAELHRLQGNMQKPVIDEFDASVYLQKM
ncbi:hypothetical protein QYF36_008850 [Acer negundo]|nr:hypothetical protein QYF36_008850 [Acer negundo]